MCLCTRKLWLTGIMAGSCILKSLLIGYLEQYLVLSFVAQCVDVSS